jgi:DNA helicase HerA-like ATPase
VTRVEPEIWVSADPGEEAARATGEERRKALYADEMERPLPIGLGRDGAPVHVDLDFFDGRKGGHMSISGISGVATKTSFALFFLRVLTSSPDVVGPGAANLRVLVFNVKGEDLLWLDRPNRLFEAQEAAREDWAALGIEPGPFPSVRFWAPPRRQSGDVVVPDTGGRFEGVDVFSWTPRAFIDQDLLEFCFTDANDAKNQIPFIRERVQLQLKRWAVGIEGMPGAVALRDPSQAPDGHAWSHDDRIPAAQADVVITDLPSLVGALEVHLEPEDGGDPDPAWTAKVMPGTVAAFLRRMHAAAARLGHLIRADEDRRIDRAAANVTVVAIQSLHEQAQRFVVGALLRETFKEKEDTGQRLPLSVIVLDELNKYAPREGTGPLKDMLIDIAQRGRSLGVLLVGAQQTASRVAPEVLENAAIRVSGRLDAAEAERAEYGWMLPSTRARARLLKPGTMVVSQPAIPVPLVVTFPFPPWATRKEEVADAGDDPFAGLT